MNKKKPAPKKQVGRPSLYKCEYSDMLMQHMAQGFSVESFAAVIGVCRDTLYEWQKAHAEFSYSIKKGKDASQYHWEKILMAGTMGKIKGFSPGAAIFTMKNRFGWRDQIAVEDLNETKEYEKALSDALAEMNKVK